MIGRLSMLTKVPTNTRLSSRAGHVCSENAVLVLLSPHNRFYRRLISYAATENSKLLSPGSLAWTNLVAPIGAEALVQNKNPFASAVGLSHDSVAHVSKLLTA